MVQIQVVASYAPPTRWPVLTDAMLLPDAQSGFTTMGFLSAGKPLPALALWLPALPRT